MAWQHKMAGQLSKTCDVQLLFQALDLYTVLSNCFGTIFENYINSIHYSLHIGI